MKGIWFMAKGVTQFQEEADPVCAEDTVLLKTLYSGLSNGTERNKLMGGNYSRGKWPDRIAYQHVSEVVECGAEIQRFAPGDIVYTATYPGHVPYHLARESDLIVKLPDVLDRPSAALFGLAGVALQNISRAEVGAGDRVLVVGLGPIGLFAVQAAVARGAQVAVVDRHQDRLQLARSYGAEQAVDNGDGQAWEELKKGERFTACLECSGGEVLQSIIGTSWGSGLLAREARMAFVAGRFDASIPFNAASSCKLHALFSSHFEQSTLEQVVQLAAEQTLDPQSVLRDVVPIDRAISVYDSLRDEKQKLLGTVFDWKDGIA